MKITIYKTGDITPSVIHVILTEYGCPPSKLEKITASLNAKGEYKCDVGLTPGKIRELQIKMLAVNIVVWEGGE